MNGRAPWLVGLLFAALALLGCGRSTLLQTTADGGLDAATDARRDGASDGAACNADTCPTGCCDAAGVCRAGSGLTQCGAFGVACRDCRAGGYDFCDAS